MSELIKRPVIRAVGVVIGKDGKVKQEVATQPQTTKESD